MYFLRRGQPAQLGMGNLHLTVPPRPLFGQQHAPVHDSRRHPWDTSQSVWFAVRRARTRNPVRDRVGTTVVHTRQHAR
ncbi:hypothetical protein D9V28_06270 [Mycetocola zhadangensis]|uniref:Uncharacterized protein n=1 Tax=Mycetocola zhadangensis TaxID=1164595 RepID=A0A3L7J6S8_9MICO|nr:hypothetical protein D9V28_06270 [Mycetocola zhadangensis]